MSRTRVVRVLQRAIVLTCFLPCVLASGQASDKPSSTIPTMAGLGSYRYQLSAGYSHVATDLGIGLNGFTVSISRGIVPWFQVVGEAGRYYGRGTSQNSFLAGPRFRVRALRVQPFVHSLFGLTTSGPNRAFTLVGGGGIDIPWKEHIGLRPFQADFYGIAPGNWFRHGGDYFRIGFGLTYDFGETGVH